MKHRNLSPDEAAVGGGTTEASVQPNFGMLSEDMFDPDYNPTAIKQEKEVEKKVEEDNKEQTPADLRLRGKKRRKRKLKVLKLKLKKPKLKN